MLHVERLLRMPSEEPDPITAPDDSSTSGVSSGAGPVPLEELEREYAARAAKRTRRRRISVPWTAMLGVVVMMASAGLVNTAIGAVARGSTVTYLSAAISAVVLVTLGLVLLYRFIRRQVIVRKLAEYTGIGWRMARPLAAIGIQTVTHLASIEPILITHFSGVEEEQVVAWLAKYRSYVCSPPFG